METLTLPAELESYGFKTQLKVLVASTHPTFVIGQIYILLDFAKVSDFPKGSILVTEQTSPECTNAIENAKAVITERGGILCHAAIVCRDLNVPCVVGVRGVMEKVQTGMTIAICTKTGKIFI